MIPNLIGAMCAITWHIFDNQSSLYGLVTLQGIFTFIGNTTLAIATIVIYKRTCLLYTSPSPRDKRQSRMPSSA